MPSPLPFLVNVGEKLGRSQQPLLALEQKAQRILMRFMSDYFGEVLESAHGPSYVIILRSNRVAARCLRTMHMHTSALIRPAWTPATIALMVVGFMVFWPLGLAMLAYVIWGDRLDGFKRDVNQATDGMFRAAKGFGRQPAYTGNMAFDEWRNAEIERLNQERRKLDEMRAEFEEELRELRRAKDQEDFDRFMAKRNGGAKPRGKSVPDTSTE
jgi:Protein of unknown function (DUF2852)